MKLSYQLLIPIAFIAMSFTCNGLKRTGSLQKHFKNLEVTELSAQSTIPGIATNLVKTTSYNLDLKCDVLKEIEILSFLIDSVTVNINSINLEGKRWTKEQSIIPGNYDSIKITANRYFYSPESDSPSYNQIEYDVSDYNVPEGKALLLYQHQGDLFTLELGVLKVNETIYAP